MTNVHMGKNKTKPFHNKKKHFTIKIKPTSDNKVDVNLQIYLSRPFLWSEIVSESQKSFREVRHDSAQFWIPSEQSLDRKEALLLGIWVHLLLGSLVPSTQLSYRTRSK